ncbi:MAG: RNA polymerase sigma factor [Polyangiales bacterium]
MRRPASPERGRSYVVHTVRRGKRARASDLATSGLDRSTDHVGLHGRCGVTATMTMNAVWARGQSSEPHYTRGMDAGRLLVADESLKHDARAEELRNLASQAMNRYAAGDDRAFDDVYALLAPRLYRLCICLIGRTDADDLLQEVFLKMHRARASFVPGGSVLAWSFAIARTTSIDRMRHRGRRPEDATSNERLEMHAGGGHSSPEASSFGRALEDVFEQKLAALSESLRSAYVLVKMEGMSCAEAGEVLGASTSAIKQRVHRASEELKAAASEAGW